jgi:circadian clock protein KaiC
MESSELSQIVEIKASSKVKNGRVPTGIEGFDTLIEGGIPRGYLVLVAGTAGSGKTIFAAQYLYHGLSRFNDPGIYMSFAETRKVFMDNMKRMGMDFEKYEQNGKFKFLDLVTVKEKGVESVVERILREVSSLNANRLVIDSFTALAQAFTEKIDARIVLHTILGKIAHLNEVTTLLISEKILGTEWLGGGMEEFVADGVVTLNSRTEKGWMKRVMQVLKLRGTKINTVECSYNIDEHGIRIWPEPKVNRVEKVFTRKMSTGIKGLDLMLYDGVFESSVTMMAGAAGTGKTTAALRFITEGAEHKERGLYLTVEEPPQQLVEYGNGFGFDMKQLTDKGLIKIIYYTPESSNVEQLFLEIKSLLREYKPSRFVIDSLEPFEQAMKKERFVLHLKSLVSFLKAEGVTSLFLALGKPTLSIARTGISTLVDNIIFLRHVEIESVLRRSLVIMKARGSVHDNDIREFEITPKGIVVKGKFVGMEQILGGSPSRSVTEEVAESWAKAFGGKA